MSKDNEDKDFTVADHVSKDKLKVIQETFDIYSDEAIEIKRKANLKNISSTPKTPESKPVEAKSADFEMPEQEPVQVKKEKASKFSVDPNLGNNNAAIIKKIIFEIDSIENLNPNLQKNIKRLMNSVTKQEVSKLIEEIEREKDKFLTDSGSVLGKMSSTEKNTLERKLAENEVAKEVIEINLSAILAGLNKLVID
jgi:hypothetical protein